MSPQSVTSAGAEGSPQPSSEVRKLFLGERIPSWILKRGRDWLSKGRERSGQRERLVQRPCGVRQHRLWEMTFILRMKAGVCLCVCVVSDPQWIGNLGSFMKDFMC